MEKISIFFEWFFPGSGYFLIGRKTRGLIIGLSIWSMFIIGALSGGLNYGEFSKDSSLLYYLNLFACFGNGLGWVISLFFGSSSFESAAKITYEYGGRLIEIAGLLNYMAIFDVLDVSLGRKK